MTRVLLIMRNTYGWNGEHIDALLRLGIEVHIATKVAHATMDSRFRSVVPIQPELDLASTVTLLVDAAQRLEVATALTFYESDIVLTTMVNQALGQTSSHLQADLISRDKRLQREFMARKGIPSVGFAAIPSSDPVGAGIAAAARLCYPLIVKPTFLSASIGVTLARDEESLVAALKTMMGLGETWESYFLADVAQPIALVEEFLPGHEVTVDGVALFGRFHLSGVTNKMQMPGPYFEEDYYTLPFRTPEEEPELTELCSAIVEELEVDHCLFNAEFRKDAAGRYRVIEFSTRLSGGQNYMCLRDVYALDPVRLYVKAVLAGTDPSLEEGVWSGELRRQPPRMATCIKYAYRTGTLVRNNAGIAAHSPYFRSYLTASQPGTVLHRAPEGWYEFCGSLATAAPYSCQADIDRIEKIADELDAKLDIVVA